MYISNNEGPGLTVINKHDNSILAEQIHNVKYI